MVILTTLKTGFFFRQCRILESVQFIFDMDGKAFQIKGKIAFPEFVLHMLEDKK